jgi:mannose-6-phosphate isomerase-like protein (cupin superfamily)
MRKILVGLLATLAPSLALALDWVGVPGNGQPTRKNLDQMMREYPLGANERIRMTPLSNGGLSATYLMQVRTAQPLHHHTDSDVTMFLARGEGTIRIGDRVAPVKTGDVIHIPRNTVHAYTNTGPGVSVLILVYSPAPGPNDLVRDDDSQ